MQSVHNLIIWKGLVSYMWQIIVPIPAGTGVETDVGRGDHV